MHKKTIMVVDDEKEIRELFRDVLAARGYEVIACSDGMSAIETLGKYRVFTAFLDIRLPGMDGIQTLKEIKAKWPETHVVMITGYTRDEAVEEALRLGGFVCMMKPFKLRDILGVIEILEAGITPLARAA